MSSSPISSSSSSTELAAPLPFARLLDVSCPVSVVLGAGTISVRESLALQRHSVLSLHQPAGEDLRVTVNGILLARGEVVIVDDSSAVRLTEIAPAPGVEGLS